MWGNTKLHTSRSHASFDKRRHERLCLPLRPSEAEGSVSSRVGERLRPSRSSQRQSFPSETAWANKERIVLPGPAAGVEPKQSHIFTDKLWRGGSISNRDSSYLCNQWIYYLMVSMTLYNSARLHTRSTKITEAFSSSSPRRPVACCSQLCGFKVFFWEAHRRRSFIFMDFCGFIRKSPSSTKTIECHSGVFSVLLLFFYFLFFCILTQWPSEPAKWGWLWRSDSRSRAAV